MGEWYSKRIEDILRELKSTEKGLTEEEAKRRLQYVYNELIEKKRITPLRIFLNQFKNVMVAILLFGAVLSIAIWEILDAVVILSVLMANALLGFVQEYKAERTLESLKKLTTPHATVIRDGQRKSVLARELVPGDIIFVEQGMKVPADARIIKESELSVDESILTGESEAVRKNLQIILGKVQTAEMKNMIFMGTLVTAGSATAIVTDTGMNTSIGAISVMVQQTKEQRTPLQMELDTLGKILGVSVTVIIFLMILFVGLFSQRPVTEMILVAISLAISAIPEGLPAILTVTLALGVQRMVKKNVIVRKLSSVETLGCTNIICTDKTGTLTKNEMTVKEIALSDRKIEVTGTGYTPDGEFLLNNKKMDMNDDDLKLLLKTGFLCNNATLQKINDKWESIGDHTEGALVVLARKARIDKTDEVEIHENPFDSRRKMMSKIFLENNDYTAYVKGAPEAVLENCAYYRTNGKTRILDEKTKQKFFNETRKMANTALRVLALAYKKVEAKQYAQKQAETKMTLLGLVGMYDPPRKEVKQSIQECKTAGIRVIMITGDHAITAQAIAKEIGLADGDINVITGIELDSMNDNTLDESIRTCNVFARVSPEHKVRILNSLKKDEKAVVAMTGDGVNDAPALKHSDIGVAMGLKGTEVAKESSQMILMDDNFTSIVSAVKEGRVIYDNIRKFVRYILSANFSELILIVTAILLHLPLPLLAIQILWLNLITDGLPAISLGRDPAAKDIMKRPPRNIKTGIVQNMILFALLSSIINAIVTIIPYFIGLQTSVEKARTMVLTGGVFFELMLVFIIRSQTRTILETGLSPNKYLIVSVIISALLQIMVIYIPLLQDVFKLTGLVITDWLLILGLDIVGITILDFSKIILKKMKLSATD